MAKIKKLKENNITIYPATIPQAVVDPTTGKSLSEELSKITAELFPLAVTVSGGGVFEKGASRTITVKWTVKEGNDVVQPDTVLVNGDSVSATETSKVFEGVSATTTYTVKATKGSSTAQGSTTATFVAPMYFGFAQTSEVSSLDIVSLTKQSIKTSASGSYSLNNPTTGYYLWLCVPSSMSIKKVTSSGFDVPMEAAANGSTAIDSYKCYRSSSAINAGVMSIVVS